MSKVIVYSFFKNIVLTFVLFYYQADCGWSGTSFYEAWVYSGFNFFLAFTPLAFSWFDVDTSAETVRKYPRLYAAGLHRMDLNVRRGVSFVPPSRRRRRRECFSLRLLPSSHWRAVGVTPRAAAGLKLDLKLVDHGAVAMTEKDGELSGDVVLNTDGAAVAMTPSQMLASTPAGRETDGADHKDRDDWFAAYNAPAGDGISSLLTPSNTKLCAALVDAF